VSERTALYRMYGDANRLLYIGISKNFGMRWQKHASTQPWWPQVKRQTIDWYDSREEARAAELAAIPAEKPLYNKYDTRPIAASPSAPKAPGACPQRGERCRRSFGCSGSDGIGYTCLLWAAAA
jgi:hypothetical protein